MYSDEIRQQEEENSAIEVDIHPISRWKRFLLAISDLTIHFILSFILLMVATTPLLSFITKSDVRGEEMRSAEINRDDVLYNNSILFARHNSKTDYNDNLLYTFDRYLSYYVNSDVSEGEFSHDIKNEVIHTFFIGIRNDEITYIDLYSKQNVKYEYFTISESNISLREEYRIPLTYYFIEGESLGKNGQEIYNNISTIFTILYKQVMGDIYKNDLTYGSESFIKWNNELMRLQNHDRIYFAIAIFAAYLIAYIILYVVVPLINHRGKTITMYIMKVERIGINNLSRLKTFDTILTYLYYLIFNFTMLIFLPLTFMSYSLVYILNLPFIPYFFIVGLLLNIVSLFFIIFNSMNRSLCDIFSKSVVVSAEELDHVDMMKGYDSGR